MTLRVRDFEGFKPASSVDLNYVRKTPSFSIYLHDYQICRLSSDGDGVDLHITLEIFDAKLYFNNAEQINHIIELYQDL